MASARCEGTIGREESGTFIEVPLDAAPGARSAFDAHSFSHRANGSSG